MTQKINWSSEMFNSQLCQQKVSTNAHSNSLCIHTGACNTDTLLIHTAVDKLATHITKKKKNSQGQWHWFVRLSIGIESNKAPRRGKNKRTTLHNYKLPIQLLHQMTQWATLRLFGVNPSQRWNKVALSQHWQPAQLLHCLLVHTGALTVCVYVCVWGGAGCSYWGVFVGSNLR